MRNGAGEALGTALGEGQAWPGSAQDMSDAEVKHVEQATQLEDPVPRSELKEETKLQCILRAGLQDGDLLVELVALGTAVDMGVALGTAARVGLAAESAHAEPVGVWLVGKTLLVLLPGQV